MLLGISIALGIASGAHPGLVLIVVLAFVRPGWFLAGVVVWTVYARWSSRVRTGPRAEAAFLEGVAAELRGGASLRTALADAADRTDLELAAVVRLARAGRPMEDIASRLADHLPVNGGVAGPALNLASSAGSSVAGVFDALALRASEVAEEERQRMSLTAQARLSSWLIGGAPAVVALGMFVFGGSPISGGRGATTIAAAGFGLQLAGAAVVWAMVRAHRW